MREAIKASTNWEHGDNLKKKNSNSICAMQFILFYTVYDIACQNCFRYLMITDSKY